MKIGIITFHYGYNYGAALQCTGLYKTLEQMGHDVDVIDYQPLVYSPSVYFWKGWGLRKKNRLQRIKKRWVELRYGGLMRRKFDKFFAKNLTFSKACDNLDVAEVVAGYAALIVGSDQVWNRSYSNVTPVYFLDFADTYLGRKISYAACCGHSKMPLENIGAVKRALLQFDAISVRNRITHEWVRELTDMNSAIVCDPTFLYDYSSLEPAEPPPYKNYILTYVLGKEIGGGHRRAIAKIKEKYGDLPVVWICSSAHKPESFCKWADRIVYTAGPAEWLNLVKNAAFVYTDSFHGTVFAMKYRKPFLAYYTEESRAERLRDLAERYGIDHSVVRSLQDTLERKCLEIPPDYESVTDQINRHRRMSLSFLKESLSL